MDEIDVVVIGAGHAGCEAAYAAARMGCRVGLCTLSDATVAHMPCNPAIGGTAKGHLVREIDALGGLMGIAIDATGLQFKLLNRSRGPAVWSPRAQADKKQYGVWVKRELTRQPGIDWIIGRVGEILVEHGRVAGVATACVLVPLSIGIDSARSLEVLGAATARRPKITFFMYTISGIPNEFSGCTLK